MKRILFAIVAFFVTMSGFAQNDGFKIGYGLMPDRGFDAYINDISLEYFGFIHVDNNVKIQPGIEFDIDFKKKAGVKLSMTDISLPVNVDFQIDVKTVTLMPYAGLHLKYYLTGQSKVGDKSVNLFSKKDMGDAAYNQLQFGGQVGFDVILDWFIVGIGGEIDFTKFNKHLNDNTKKIFLKAGMVF